MSNIALSIGGRSFTVACADGEEAHIAGLGRMIDEKLSAMGDMSGPNESRMLLFAALLLADEVHETRFRTPSAAGGALPDATLGRIDRIAGQLENLADALEQGQPSA